MVAVASLLTMAAARAELPANPPADGAAPAGTASAAPAPALPPLETREVGTRPAPKTPQDMLLPGERLHSRWADPGTVTAAAAPPVPVRPAVPRAAAVLPPPLHTGPAVPAPAPVAAPAKPAKPAKPAATPASGRKRPGLILGPAGCTGEYHLDGIAVDALGHPCASF
ncbi:hypothetical protein [Zavarzinia sp.]|uniref:hypothetical protein n=1 Tax=Zavarzinia sp. TaxID=2027920 RepID=UPI003562CBAB